MAVPGFYVKFLKIYLQFIMIWGILYPDVICTIWMIGGYYEEPQLAYLAHPTGTFCGVAPGRIHLAGSVAEEFLRLGHMGCGCRYPFGNLLCGGWTDQQSQDHEPPVKRAPEREARSILQ